MTESKSELPKHWVQRPRTLLVGTAQAVAHLAQSLRLAEPDAHVVGALLPRSTAADDGAALAPVVPLLGNVEALAQTVTAHDVQRVLISWPANRLDEVHALAEQLDDLNVTWRFLPTLPDQLAGCAAPLDHAPPPTPRTVVSRLDRVDPVALLDRQPAPLDEDAIGHTLRDRRVCITGAGGSIGSELARIVCRFAPQRIVLVERAENALFEVDREIARLFPDQSRAAVLHDVTDAPRTAAVVMAERPDLILHAAAHKHVPMMEDHPAAAVENNFYGTRSIADAACRAGVERFVMISTDKAVNPRSVMGATKRLAELYIQYLAARRQTTFSMVRFGNVLGSACSVLPIWARQLADGEPLTVTDPQMMRYFMTIPEAAGLVLQSAAMARAGGEVFLLDMGKPIRIVDLARRFIRAHGLEPDTDVPIVYTGIRPGEKLHEELAYDSEDMLPTLHGSIRIWRTTPPDPLRMQQTIAAFDRLRAPSGIGAHHWNSATRQQILDALRDAIPEMHRPAQPQLRLRA